MNEQEYARRLEALETRQAFQDDTQNSLSDVLAQQAKDIAALRRQIEHLGERLQEALSNAPGAADQEQPPPHY